ncbi:ketoacyl-synthetase C-terminal extension domain-containing protein [Streptomyces kaempferi]
MPVKATDWPEGRERVAAVSSFGIGGTNAHVVVEEETGTQLAETGDVPRCLVLSASSADALTADAARIADHLQLRPEQYESVLRHLQAGRPAHRLRIAAPAADATAAVRWLRAVAADEIPYGTADPDAVPVPAAGCTAQDLAQDWTAGRPVEWQPGPAPAPWDFPPPAFALATYDFHRKPQAYEPALPQRRPQSEWLHQPHWVRMQRATPVTASAPRTPLVVVVAQDNVPQEAFTPFEAVAARVVRVRPAGAFARGGPDVFQADPADPESLALLLDALSKDTGHNGDRNLANAEWVHALPLAVTGPVGSGTLEDARRACLDSTAALAQALSGRTGSPRVWWLSYAARPVTGTVERPELALLAGPVEVAHQEDALAGHWLDLPDGDLTRWAGHVASALATAARAVVTGDPALPRQLALRDGFWWRPGITPVPAPTSVAAVAPAGGDGVHLVLGGTGGIGRAIAAWLLEHTGGRVLLLSRTPQLPQELTHFADRIDLLAADLATTPVHEVAAAVAARTTRLDGIVHAAASDSGACSHDATPPPCVPQPQYGTTAPSSQNS